MAFSFVIFFSSLAVGIFVKISHLVLIRPHHSRFGLIIVCMYYRIDNVFSFFSLNFKYLQSVLRGPWEYGRHSLFELHQAPEVKHAVHKCVFITSESICFTLLQS